MTLGQNPAAQLLSLWQIRLYTCSKGFSWCFKHLTFPDKSVKYFSTKLMLLIIFYLCLCLIENSNTSRWKILALVPFFSPWLAFMDTMNVCLNCTWSSYPSAKNKWQITLKPASVGTLHITLRSWEEFSMCVPCQPCAHPCVPSSPVRHHYPLVKIFLLPECKIHKLN